MFDIQKRMKLLVLAGALSLVTCAPSASEEPADPESGPGVAATIGDRTITLEQLDAKAQSQDMKAYQALYDARRRALEQMINEQVIEQKATAAGVTPEEFVRTELEKRSQPVSDAAIEAFYEQQKARLQGQTLDQARPQIQQFLARQQAAATAQDLYKELRENVAVQVHIEPPRAEIVVAANERTKGPDTAKITIVEYSDFQ